MTDLTRDEIQQLLDNATPGPDHPCTGGNLAIWMAAPRLATQLLTALDDNERLREDLDAVAAGVYREHVVRALQAENERLRAALDAVTRSSPAEDAPAPRPEVPQTKAVSTKTQHFIDTMKTVTEWRAGR